MVLGQVVRHARTGRIGVVIDAWPTFGDRPPEGTIVRWEPLLGGEVSTLAADEYAIVPLGTTQVTE